MRNKQHKSRKNIQIFFNRLTKKIKMKKNNLIKEYLSNIGRKGGQKSRGILTPEQARAMVIAREQKRALKLNEN
jgi:hypothetical protein